MLFRTITFLTPYLA